MRAAHGNIRAADVAVFAAIEFPVGMEVVDRGAEATGLVWLGVTPKRKDLLLLDGSIFLRPEDGDLVRVQGLLSKNPSFWTRHVEITRHYERIAGVRLPVAFESVANVLLAGKSTFKMTYTYQTVNGQPISTSVP